MAVATAPAFPAATGTSMRGVTIPAAHAAPSSGNDFMPQANESPAPLITSVRACVTSVHFEGLVAVGGSPSAVSCIDADRSSTTNRSIGARTGSKLSTPQIEPPQAPPDPADPPRPAGASAASPDPATPPMPPASNPGSARPAAPSELSGRASPDAV